MKRIFTFVILFLTFTFTIFVISDAIARDKKSKSSDKKSVILTTVDIDEDYEILGLVYYRSGTLDVKKIHDELGEQAEAMGADYVIGVTYYSNLNYLYATGTAVKLIKKDKTEE